MSAQSLPIYLDHSATTPVDVRVVQAMVPWLGERFGNPASSSHVLGRTARDAVEAARVQVAELIGAAPREIIWTSGATEADNLALKGVAHANRARGRHLITAKTEHKAVLDSCHALQDEGYEVTFLDVDGDGLVSESALRAALREDTVLVSIMLVNNEIGVIQDVAALARLCHAHGVLFHTDAAQATGKIPVDVQALGVDLMSLSAHKTYGPKGIGALYVRRASRVRIEAQMHGGGHERGLRSGTLPTHQIVGMGEAYALAGALMDDEVRRIGRLRDRLWAGLRDLPGVFLNGSAQARVVHNLNFSVAGIEGESLMLAMPELALSAGSACTSASQAPSHVLQALGRDPALAHTALRITLGRETTQDEVDCAVRVLRAQIQRLRAISPLWDVADANEPAAAALSAS